MVVEPGTWIPKCAMKVFYLPVLGAFDINVDDGLILWHI
jgi:hypothetical protein